jgi:hypothetical protein
MQYNLFSYVHSSCDVECMFRGKAYTFNPERLNKMWGHGARAGDKERRKAKRMAKREELRNNLKLLQNPDYVPPKRSSLVQPGKQSSNGKRNSVKIVAPETSNKTKAAKGGGHAFSNPDSIAQDWKSRPMLVRERVLVV